MLVLVVVGENGSLAKAGRPAAACDNLERARHRIDAEHNVPMIAGHDYDDEDEDVSRGRDYLGGP